MTNITNGGRTPVAGVVHAIVLFLIFLFLMPLINLIPMACLAAVLIVVSYNMSGWRTIRLDFPQPQERHLRARGNIPSDRNLRPDDCD